jgi:hypothetical protein
MEGKRHTASMTALGFRFLDATVNNEKIDNDISSTIESMINLQPEIPIKPPNL